MLTKLKAGNAQFPEEKDIGDVVVLHNGDIFCWDGGIWQLIGGRYLPKRIRDEFISYVKYGWPDADSAVFDMKTLLDLQIFLPELEREPGMDKDKLVMMEKFTKRFFDRVIEVSERCEKASKKGLTNSEDF